MSRAVRRAWGREFVASWAVVVFVAFGTVEPATAQESRGSTPVPRAALAEEAARRCRQARSEEGAAVRADSGIVLGRVVDGSTGRPVAEAQVWVGATAEDEAPERYETSGDGVFLLCGLPTDGREIRLQASAARRLSDSLTVRLSAGRVMVRDLVLWNVRGEEWGLAQGSLRGVVQAAETAEPLEGAEVEVVGSGERARTGKNGAFTIRDLAPGEHRVVTRYLGRASDTVRVRLAPGETEALTLLMLETRPVELPGLQVEVRSAESQRLSGYYERLDRGQGDFITREDLERGDIIHNFRRILGVRVFPVESGGRSGSSANDYKVRLTRGVGLTGASDCPPLVYWNGALITTPGFEAEYEEIGLGAFQRLQDFPRDLLEGIEVYRNPATAPGRYRMVGDACGIILVWTRAR